MTSIPRKVILAIETSCDDTAASVCINGKIASNVVAGQDVHEQYGGVVPELASRAHQQHIVPVVDLAMRKAGVDRADLNAIGYTQGPGLLGSLLVGSSFARGLCLGLGIPLIGVNHIQAHVLAHFIDEPHPAFPFLCLLVSGGHTQLVLVRSAANMEIIGATRDDAAGEAFDKSAKILGLPYPGGPLIDRYATNGDPNAFSFPDSRVPGLDFSFSGIKTAVLYFVREQLEKDPSFVQKNLNDLCASIQHTIVSYLMRKVHMAVQETGIKRVGLAGGVSANSALREALRQYGENEKAQVFIPAFEYCTDNAAMIGIAAYYQFNAGNFQSLNAVPYARYDH